MRRPFLLLVIAGLLPVGLSASSAARVASATTVSVVRSADALLAVTSHDVSIRQPTPCPTPTEQQPAEDRAKPDGTGATAASGGGEQDGQGATPADEPCTPPAAPREAITALTVTNHFAATADITAAIEADPAGVVQGAAVERTLAPGAQADMRFVFTPEHAPVGTHTVRFKVTGRTAGVQATLLVDATATVEAAAPPPTRAQTALERDVPGGAGGLQSPATGSVEAPVPAPLGATGPATTPALPLAPLAPVVLPPPPVPAANGQPPGLPATLPPSDAGQPVREPTGPVPPAALPAPPVPASGDSGTLVLGTRPTTTASLGSTALGTSTAPLRP